MTDAHASHAFDAHAAEYDAMRRRLIPSFDRFYGAAVEAAGPAPRRILDLGAGTGMLSRMLADAYPAAAITLLDAAPAMLAQAEALLGDRAAYVTADLADPLPDGPWDTIVSALAIHHLDDAAKRDLFARVHDALEPGGVFVNAEQVAGPSPEAEAGHRRWHRDHALAAGATGADWAAAEERMRFDRCATTGDQLAWLRDAGFEAVGCPLEDHRFAVLVGARRAH
jgi:tRNA (cmo5U34)-methyltransferase